jgi:plastocyanin
MPHADGGLRFVQISDSHIGFDKPANTDVTATHTDGQFSHRFDAAGTYKYFCSIHPKMTGEIVVR